MDTAVKLVEEAWVRIKPWFDFMKLEEGAVLICPFLATVAMETADASTSEKDVVGSDRASVEGSEHDGDMVEAGVSCQPEIKPGPSDQSLACRAAKTKRKKTDVTPYHDQVDSHSKGDKPNKSKSKGDKPIQSKSKEDKPIKSKSKGDKPVSSDIISGPCEVSKPDVEQGDPYQSLDSDDDFFIGDLELASPLLPRKPGKTPSPRSSQRKPRLQRERSCENMVEKMSIETDTISLSSVMSDTIREEIISPESDNGASTQALQARVTSPTQQESGTIQKVEELETVGIVDKSEAAGRVDKIQSDIVETVDRSAEMIEQEDKSKPEQAVGTVDKEVKEDIGQTMEPRTGQEWQHDQGVEESALKELVSETEHSRAVAAQEMVDPETVEKERGSTVVQEMAEPETVEKERSSTVVQEMAEPETVEKERSSTVVQEMAEPETVEKERGSTVVQEMAEPETVEKERSSTVVQEMEEGKTVKEQLQTVQEIEQKAVEKSQGIETVEEGKKTVSRKEEPEPAHKGDGLETEHHVEKSETVKQTEKTTLKAESKSETVSEGGLSEHGAVGEMKQMTVTEGVTFHTVRQDIEQETSIDIVEQEAVVQEAKETVVEKLEQETVEDVVKQTVDCKETTAADDAEAVPFKIVKAEQITEKTQIDHVSQTIEDKCVLEKTEDHLISDRPTAAVDAHVSVQSEEDVAVDNVKTKAETIDGVKTKSETVEGVKAKLETELGIVDGVRTASGTIDGVKTELESVDGVRTELEIVDNFKTEVRTKDGVKTEVKTIDGAKAKLETELETVVGVRTEAERVDGVKAKLETVKTEVETIDGVKAEVETDDGVKAKLETELETVDAVKTEVETIDGVKAEVETVDDVKAKLETEAETVDGVKAKLESVAGAQSEVQTTDGVKSELVTLDGVKTNIDARLESKTDKPEAVALDHGKTEMEVDDNKNMETTNLSLEREDVARDLQLQASVEVKDELEPIVESAVELATVADAPLRLESLVDDAVQLEKIIGDTSQLETFADIEILEIVPDDTTHIETPVDTTCSIAVRDIELETSVDNIEELETFADTAELEMALDSAVPVESSVNEQTQLQVIVDDRHKVETSVVYAGQIETNVDPVQTKTAIDMVQLESGNAVKSMQLESVVAGSFPSETTVSAVLPLESCIDATTPEDLFIDAAVPMETDSDYVKRVETVDNATCFETVDNVEAKLESFVGGTALLEAEIGCTVDIEKVVGSTVEISKFGDEENKSETVYEKANLETVDHSNQIETVDDRADLETVDDRADLETVDDGVELETVDYRVQLETVDDRVHLETVNGRVQLEKVDDRVQLETVDYRVQLKTVDFKVQLETADYKVQLETVDDRVHVETVDDKVQLEAVDDRVHLETVDDGVELETVDDKVQLEAVDDRVQLETVDERVQLETVVDRVQLETVDDRVQLETVDDRVQLETVDDRVQIETVDDRVQLETVDDRVQLETVADRVQLETVDDRVQLETVDDRVQLETVDDRVQLETVDDRVQLEAVDDRGQLETVNDRVQLETVDERVQLETVDERVQLETVDDKVQLETVDDKPQLEVDDDNVSGQVSVQLERVDSDRDELDRIMSLETDDDSAGDRTMVWWDLSSRQQTVIHYDSGQLESATEERNKSLIDTQGAPPLPALSEEKTLRSYSSSQQTFTVPGDSADSLSNDRQLGQGQVTVTAQRKQDVSEVKAVVEVSDNAGDRDILTVKERVLDNTLTEGTVAYDELTPERVGVIVPGDIEGEREIVVIDDERRVASLAMPVNVKVAMVQALARLQDTGEDSGLRATHHQHQQAQGQGQGQGQGLVPGNTVLADVEVHRQPQEDDAEYTQSSAEVKPEPTAVDGHTKVQTKVPTIYQPEPEAYSDVLSNQDSEVDPEQVVAALWERFESDEDLSVRAGPTYEETDQRYPATGVREGAGGRHAKESKLRTKPEYSSRGLRDRLSPEGQSGDRAESRLQIGSSRARWPSRELDYSHHASDSEHTRHSDMDDDDVFDSRLVSELDSMHAYDGYDSTGFVDDSGYSDSKTSRPAVKVSAYTDLRPSSRRDVSPDVNTWLERRSRQEHRAPRGERTKVSGKISSLVQTATRSHGSSGSDSPEIRLQMKLRNAVAPFSTDLDSQSRSSSREKALSLHSEDEFRQSSLDRQGNGSRSSSGDRIYRTNDLYDKNMISLERYANNRFPTLDLEEKYFKNKQSRSTSREKATEAESQPQNYDKEDEYRSRAAYHRKKQNVELHRDIIRATGGKVDYPRSYISDTNLMRRKLSASSGGSGGSGGSAESDNTRQQKALAMNRQTMIRKFERRLSGEDFVYRPVTTPTTKKPDKQAKRKTKKHGPLSLHDSYGAGMDGDSSQQHVPRALSASSNHLSESTTSLGNRGPATVHSPSNKTKAQVSIQRQQSVQSEVNGRPEDQDTHGIKFERLKNLQEEELLPKIKELCGFLERLEDYHRGDGMRVQKMLGDMYWDYPPIRETIGDAMAEYGYGATSMKQLKTLNSMGIFKNDDVWFPTYYTYNTMWNFTDASAKLAQALAEHDAVRLLTLNCGHKPYINALHSKNVYYVLKASISILHNVARNPGMKHLFDDNKTSETVMPFMQSEDEMLKILATLTIANIVDEEENKAMIMDTGTIQCIVSWIDKALNLPRRRYRGFTPQELTEGLNRLAVNDNNKMKIVEEGALPLFLKMLQQEDVREQSSAARVVWSLAFDKEVRQQIIDFPDLVPILEKLTESTNKSLQTNTNGSLWILKGENDVTKERSQAPRSKTHVFLSYSWSDKEIVLELRDKLRAEGYAIWIDVEKVGGSSLEAMANAVEHSAVVLVCMSEKYKQSPNCRTEAEFTFQLRKDYIPLMMQKKYRPDGWLATILGAKLYFDFSGKYPFEKSFQGLLKELRGRGQVTPGTTPANEEPGDMTIVKPSSLVSSQQQSHFMHQAPSMPAIFQVNSNSPTYHMGQEQLIKWLRNTKLTECIPAFMEFDGKLLLQLKVMRTEAPEFFYQCLEKRLNMSLIEILKFTRALEELP